MDRQQFLHHLRRSRLLSERQICQVAEQLPEGEAPRVAGAFVSAGLLTDYQARQLLRGKHQGFLLGKYRIIDQLGKGGMGFVFKAVHQTMRRTVALKVIRPDAVRNPRHLELFLREVRTAAQLNHPNIVAAFDADEDRGVHFLVMEFVEGITLRQWLKRHGPLPVALAWDLLRQAAGALDYAHRRGLVHRDVKPANLLVRRAPGGARVLKVLDFGLARLRDANARGGEGTIAVRSGCVFGTADYISPEQAQDVHAVDIRSDLYSLGCTFYHLLTGSVPFPGATSLEKLIGHVTAEPEPAEKLRPDLPAALAGVLRRLMARDPLARFQTPAELADALPGRPGPVAPSGPADTATGRGTITPGGGAADAGSGWVLEDLPVDAESPTASAPFIRAPGKRTRGARRRRGLRHFAIPAAAVLALLALLLLWLS